MTRPIFRSAITDANGDVDVGYLSLIWGLVGWGLAVGVVLVVGLFSAWRTPKEAAAILQAIGVATAAISGGFATMLGAVGLFRMGDRDRAAPGLSTTTTIEKKVETVPAVPVPVTVENPEPVPVIETKRKPKRRRP